MGAVVEGHVLELGAEGPGARDGEVKRAAHVGGAAVEAGAVDPDLDGCRRAMLVLHDGRVAGGDGRKHLHDLAAGDVTHHESVHLVELAGLVAEAVERARVLGQGDLPEAAAHVDDVARGGLRDVQVLGDVAERELRRVRCDGRVVDGLGPVDGTAARLGRALVLDDGEGRHRCAGRATLLLFSIDAGDDAVLDEGRCVGGWEPT